MRRNMDPPDMLSVSPDEHRESHRFSKFHIPLMISILRDRLVRWHRRCNYFRCPRGTPTIKQQNFMKTIREQQSALTSFEKQPPMSGQFENSNYRLFTVVFPLVAILPFILVSCESDNAAESKPEGKYEEIGKDIDRVLAVKEKIDNFCGK